MKSDASERVLKALKGFDDLPSSAHVRVPVVAAWRGCSVPTVWRHVKNGLLPLPRKFGGTTAFNVGELRRFNEGQPA